MFLADVVKGVAMQTTSLCAGQLGCDVARDIYSIVSWLGMLGCLEDWDSLASGNLW